MTIRHGVSTVSTEKSGEVVAESSGENEIRDRTGLAMGANHCGGYAGVSASFSPFTVQRSLSSPIHDGALTVEMVFHTQFLPRMLWLLHCLGLPVLGPCSFTASRICHSEACPIIVCETR